MILPSKPEIKTPKKRQAAYKKNIDYHNGGFYYNGFYRLFCAILSAPPGSRYYIDVRSNDAGSLTGRKREFGTGTDPVN